MDCLIICKSGNFALKLSDLASRSGYYCEVASTPCKLAKEGCSYCIKFNCENFDKIKELAESNNIDVSRAYKIEKGLSSNKYTSIN